MQNQHLSGTGKLALAISIAISTPAFAQGTTGATTVTETAPDLPPTIQQLTGDRTEFSPDVADCW